MEKSADTYNKILKRKVKRMLDGMGHGDASVKINLRAYSTEICVHKTFGGDTYKIALSIPERPIADSSNISKIVNQIVDKIDSKMETTIIQGEAHISIIPYDEPEATCRKCGKSSHLPSKLSQNITEESDDSFPVTPTFKSREEKINSFDGYERLLLSLYLFEKVRKKCEHDQKV